MSERACYFEERIRSKYIAATEKPKRSFGREVSVRDFSKQSMERRVLRLHRRLRRRPRLGGHLGQLFLLLLRAHGLRRRSRSAGGYIARFPRGDDSVVGEEREEVWVQGSLEARVVEAEQPQSPRPRARSRYHESLMVGTLPRHQVRC